MADLATLDKTFHFLMSRMVETGQAPHYTEVATSLGCDAEEGRITLHELAALGAGTPRLLPDTDLVAVVPPLSSIPTQYRVTVEEQRKWFAQGGLDALAVCWLFPGKTVRIDCPCLDCNQSIIIEIRDGQVLSALPSTVVGHANFPFTGGGGTAQAGAQMNLFRSEDHVHNWAQFNPDSAEGIMPLVDWLAVFSTGHRRHMLDGDYISRQRPRREQEREEALRRLSKTGPFWNR